MGFFSALGEVAAAVLDAAAEKMEYDSLMSQLNEAYKRGDCGEVGRIAKKLANNKLCVEGARLNPSTTTKAAPAASYSSTTKAAPAATNVSNKVDRLNSLSNKAFRHKSDAEAHVASLLLGDKYKWTDIDRSGCIDGIYYSIEDTREGYKVTFA